MRSADDDAQSADPMGLLCAVLRSGEDVIRGAAFGRMQDLQPLIAAGILVEQGTVTSIPCDGCDQDHLAVIGRHPQTGGLARRCPEVGYVEVDADDIRAFRVNLPAFAARLGSAFAISRIHPPVLLSGHLWRIGHAKTETKKTEVWFLSDHPTPATIAELSDHVTLSPQCDVGLLLHPGGPNAAARAMPRRTLALSLDELVTFDEGGRLSVDPDALDRAIETALPEPVPVKRGRPSAREGTREVMEWLDKRNLLPNGRNAAAKAVWENWRKVSPNAEPPAEATIRDHVTKIRG
jgi:hypothetical protein